jgi:hypothetical protein
MRAGFRRTGILFGMAALVFWCSCDKHKLGELPEVQKEHVDLAHEAREAPAASPEATAVSAEATPTPAEFFPEKKSP